MCKYILVLVFKQHFLFKKGEETARNSEENLLPTRLGSQSKVTMVTD